MTGKVIEFPKRKGSNKMPKARRHMLPIERLAMHAMKMAGGELSQLNEWLLEAGLKPVTAANWKSIGQYVDSNHASPQNLIACAQGTRGFRDLSIPSPKKSTKPSKGKAQKVA